MKNKLLLIYLLLVCNFMVSCIFSDAHSSKDIYPGLVKINSQGQSFLIGSEDAWATPDEKPAMTVSFSYDYWIGKAEVTQGQYQDIMGIIPSGVSSEKGMGSNYPVYNVTWYDAVLYCNALSKRHKLDTVYAYVTCETLPDGSAYKLEGVFADFSKNGYRLPTEAEWEYAALAGGPSAYAWGDIGDSGLAGHYAWYASNSQDVIHETKGLKANAFGLFDMAGNVMEWTNDWKGHYQDVEVSDYLGGSNPNAEVERAVKGGFFESHLTYLRPSKRSLVYPTISSTREYYIGFRVALGIINNGNYLSPLGIMPKPNAITLSSDRTAIKNQLGINGARLCFVNKTGDMRNLCYVDFSQPSLQVYEIYDTLKVFYPVISPDGRRVAFCTSAEGGSGQSSVYIRNLDSDGSGKVRLETQEAFIPRWWVDAVTLDTFLIYSSSAINNNLETKWSQDKTFKQKISEGKPEGAPQVLEGAGSYHDGLSADGQWLVTAYSRLKVKNTNTGDTATLFTSPQNGKDDEGSTQVCNLSISPDTGQSKLLFLDFGYTRASTVIGGSYGIHQVLFMTNTGGSVVSWYKAPPGESSWDHSEWSNHQTYAVSGTVNGKGEHHAIYFINLESSKYLKVAQGVSLWHPSLWVEDIDAIMLQANELGLNLDSMGRYLEPFGIVNQQDITLKMRAFWQQRGDLEIVFSGSSRMNVGVNPELITSGRALNISDGGGSLMFNNRMVNDYVLNHCPSLKVIVLDFFFETFSIPGGNITWSRGMGQSTGYAYDKAHDFWQQNTPLNLVAFMNKAPYVERSEINSLGFKSVSSKGWGALTPEVVSGDWSIASTDYKENMETLKGLARALQQKAIHLVLLNFPQSSAYKSTSFYGRHGPGRQTAQNVIEEIAAFCDSMEYVHFFDENKFGEHDYGEAEAHDFDHLSSIGAVKLSQRVDSLIQVIMK